MKVIIPMSGRSYRFKKAGYKGPKYLIDVDGFPVIEHIINLFPQDADFIFICNEEDAGSTGIVDFLNSFSIKKSIVIIPLHETGPVGAVSQIYDLIDDDEQVIINYCDFSMSWDYEDFEKVAAATDCDGAIVCYRGFHPHMLGGDNYAFVKSGPNNKFLEIKEKESFTDDKMSEFASTGTYYFRRGSYIKKHFKELMERNLCVNNEYYVSMVYNLLHEDNLQIRVYEVPYMLQWGTPLDLKIYNKWSSYYKKVPQSISNISLPNSVTIFPMAGQGSRFADEGYLKPKPLISVNEQPMFQQAMKCLPETSKVIFGCLQEHLLISGLKDNLNSSADNVEIISIEEVLPGQACTCERLLEGVDEETSILVSACDNGALWDRKKFLNLVEDEDNDVIVWSYRNNPASYYNPNMYSWLDVDENNNINEVMVKKFVGEDPFEHYAIVGTMFFRKKKHFIEALESLYTQGATTNNEYYVDNLLNEAIAKGLRLKNFQVDEYICWGTPNDLKTYDYWQTFFDTCKWHPYDYKKDFFTVCK